MSSEPTKRANATLKEPTRNRQRTPKWQRQRRANEQNHFTIATLQKQVDKSREELTTEKPDNERLKKMLVRLQSSQSDQTSEVVSEVEELRMKLKSAELEKQQLLARLESCKCHHSGKLKIMEKSVNERIQAMAESHDRTEERLKNELVTAMAHYEGRLEELVTKGKEMAASLRKQMESLEAGKNNKLSSVKSTY